MGVPDSEPEAWIIGRQHNGKLMLCLPLLRGRPEMELYQRQNPDATLVPLYTPGALALAAESAFREGWEKGVGEGIRLAVSTPSGISRDPANLDVEWQRSDAFASLKTGE